ncbi:hypothetical protein [uncultured Sphingomonas sp.]|uniref:hypothetical protein n=1 Tax=uncultured Sphingomonas sp. TaxID=158754 RepID=UPI0025D4ADD4|nr:hypothetical protein [uncultured Sphingomonas sp.]
MRHRQDAPAPSPPEHRAEMDAGMERVAALSGSRVLLLAGAESFSAAYVRRSLERCGICVVVPDRPVAQAIAEARAAHWSSIAACLAVDLAGTLLDQLAIERSAIPLLFIGALMEPCRDGAEQWLHPPFAAFQVVDALRDRLER